MNVLTALQSVLIEALKVSVLRMWVVLDLMCAFFFLTYSNLVSSLFLQKFHLSLRL